MTIDGGARPDEPRASATLARPSETVASPPDRRAGAWFELSPSQPALSLSIAQRPAPWVAAAAIGVGVLGDFALRAELGGVVVAMAIVAASALLLTSGLLRSRQSRVLVALAPVFGVWTAVRESPWLVPFDLIAAAGLLLLGVSLSRRGSVFHLQVRGLLARAWHAFLHGAAAPEVLLRALPRRRGSGPRGAAAVVRGALLAAPILVLFGVLLVSSDAVFASFVTVDVDLELSGVIEHAFVIGFVTWVMLWLVRIAAAEPPIEPGPGRARLGPTEVTIVLGSVVALFGAFAVAQLVAVVGGDDYVRRTTGVTYAEYARSGFFQLLWVAALTVAVLLVLRAATDRAAARRRLAVLFGLVCALTLLIVAVAIRRLALYQDTFGLTMLRLYCTLFAVWIGVVLVLLAAWLTRSWTRSWFPAAAAIAGLTLLLGLDVANPEAIVAGTNLQRETTTVAADTRYVGRLSDDAVPRMVELLPTLPDRERQDLRARLCDTRGADERQGWTTWTLSRARADAARRDVCPGSG